MTRPTLISGGHILTIDPAQPNLPRGDVLIIDDRIADLAPDIVCEDAERVDATGMIVCPGFVDTHRHLWQTLLRGFASDQTLAEYLVTIRLGYGGLYTAADAYLGNYAGALEALNAGVTTIADHSHIINSPEHADGALDGLADAGVRAVFCYGLASSPRHRPAAGTDGERGWRRADAQRIRATRLATDDGLISMGLAPSEVEGNKLRVAIEEIAFGRQIGARTISCHVAMGGLSIYVQPSFVTSLASAGLLGPDMLFVHGNSLDRDELDMIRESGAAISSIPEVEVQMGMGRPIVGAAIRSGTKIGLGVDIVSNIGGDMFHPMRSALSEERGARNDVLVAAKQVPRRLDFECRDVVKLGTLGGAQCLRLDDQIGSITPGKQADLICVSRRSFNTMGIRDPESLLVHYATPNDVDSVWVAGRRVKRGGMMIGVDAAVIAQRVSDARETLDMQMQALDLAPFRETMNFRNFAS